jgi:hypothetical protein
MYRLKNNRVKNFLKLSYPPPKDVVFRSIYGYATENSLHVKGKVGITLPPAKQVGFLVILKKRHIICHEKIALAVLCGVTIPFTPSCRSADYTTRAMGMLLVVVVFL